VSDRPAADRGFSLLEVMVAITVVALAAAAMINAIEGGARAQGAASERVLARLVAQNRMVETLARVSPPPQGRTQGRESALNQDFEWTQTISPAPGAGMLRVDVEVRAEARGQVVFNLTSFMAVP